MTKKRRGTGNGAKNQESATKDRKGDQPQKPVECKKQNFTTNDAAKSPTVSDNCEKSTKLDKDQKKIEQNVSSLSLTGNRGESGLSRRQRRNMKKTAAKELGSSKGDNCVKTGETARNSNSEPAARKQDSQDEGENATLQASSKEDDGRDKAFHEKVNSSDTTQNSNDDCWNKVASGYFSDDSKTHFVESRSSKSDLQTKNQEKDWGRGYSPDDENASLNSHQYDYDSRYNSKKGDNSRVRTFKGDRSSHKKDISRNIDVGARNCDNQNESWEDTFTNSNRGNAVRKARRSSYTDKRENTSDRSYDEFRSLYFKSTIDNGKVEEIEGDLFTAPEEFSLAHCVAEDMKMGSGIAVQFRRDFKRVPELLDQRQKSGGLAILQNNERYIYYLVTKPESTGKPTYQSLWKSLIKLRGHCIENGVTKLAMPQIGCGLDRLEWKEVKSMLEFVFKEVDIELRVYYLPEQHSWDSNIRSVPLAEKPRSCFVKRERYPLVQISAQTAIFYFGTENGHLSPEIEDLATKYNFIPDYKNSKKVTGRVLRTHDKCRNEVIYGLIVKNHQNDLFSFVSLDKCLRDFNNINKKDGYFYVGIQEISDQDDWLLMEKIINVMQHTLQKVDVYVCSPVIVPSRTKD